MIPKKIHYFWFGNNEKPVIIQNYIESWKTYMPEYEIIEWNETNFNINCSQYTRQAYTAKKYAFVSDYARIYVLFHFGGIYFDTDIEVCRPFDELLENKRMVLGFEDNYYVMTAFMAAEPGMNCFKDLLSEYNKKSFIKQNGKYDTLPNPVIVTAVMKTIGLEPTGKFQRFYDACEIYPYDYFSAFHIAKQQLSISENTLSIHHCMGTWQSWHDKIKPWIKSRLVAILGEKVFNSIKNKFYQARKE